MTDETPTWVGRIEFEFCARTAEEAQADLDEYAQRVDDSLFVRRTCIHPVRQGHLPRHESDGRTEVVR